jgi:hypothetical protein
LHKYLPLKKFLRITGIILLLLAAFVAYIFFRSRNRGPKGPAPVPLSVSKHSESFNRSAENVLHAYYQMTGGFVQEDTLVISRHAAELKSSLDSFKIDELEKDTIIYETAQDPLGNAKAEIKSILSDPSWGERKGSLNILSDNLRNLMLIVKYDRAKIYWQECPVAFDDRNPGNWLSPAPEVENPYLGMHSKYEKGSKEYGGPKDTINFTVTDTLNNK